MLLTKPPDSESPQPRSMAWRIFRLAAGWSLLGLGVIGLFLPVLQGFLFILSGLALLSTEVPWARRLLDRLKSWKRRAKESKRPSPAATSLSTPPNRSGSPPNTPI